MDLPDQSPGCLCTVVIPARNEAVLIPSALESLCRQRNVDGTPLDARSYEVIVFANGCADGTVAAVRAVAARFSAHAIHVIEAGERDVANVGVARKTVMDLAAERFLRAGKPRGIIASTDADTLVAADWTAQILSALNRADAVAGSVRIDSLEVEGLSPAFRTLYGKELAYRDAFAELDSLLDPVAHDPWPRHASFVGASFAVSAQTYTGAGGLPGIPLLEDREFFFALRRSGARVRHSLAVRASTSARRFARVDGGFGTFVSDLVDRGRRGESFEVEDPRITARKMRISAICRRFEIQPVREADVAELSATMTASRELWLPWIGANASPGALCEKLIACELHARNAAVPVEDAIDAIASMIGSRTAASNAA